MASGHRRMLCVRLGDRFLERFQQARESDYPLDSLFRGYICSWSVYRREIWSYKREDSKLCPKDSSVEDEGGRECGSRCTGGIGDVG